MSAKKIEKAANTFDTDDLPSIHERLRALLDESKAVYRVMEHEAEGRTELIAKIRGNRVEQAIKSIFMKMEDYLRIVNPQLVKIALRG